MPDLLGPTNPVPSYDIQQPRITTPPASDTTIQNIINPDQVTRPDQRTDQHGADDAANAARYESNYMTFVQRLRNAQNLPTEFVRVLQGMQMEVTSGIRSGFAEEMQQFLQFLNMNEGELLAFLQNQMQTGDRFSGALFDMLRNVLSGNQNELVQNDILQFLRRFSDFSSTEHIEDNILRAVADMEQSLPSPWSGQMAELLAKLRNGVAAGDRQGNLQLLRGSIFPLVSRYVSMTHDHGRARNLLSALTLDVARYENGSLEGLLQSLRHLASNGILPDGLSKLSDEELMQLLRQSDRTAGGNPFADRLAELTHRALQGEGGVKMQDAFHNILTSILINESVYMPLKHVMLPLEWKGNLMFSEMWVDPDAENDPRKPSPGGERSTRILIKMDVKSLGAFDLLIHARSEGVSVQLACPKEVAAQSEQVSRALHTILTRNGLNVEQLRVGAMKRPVAVSEAFPKLFERMSGVNVKV